MADNLSLLENEARFKEYPYDLHETWWNDLQKRKMAAIGSRIHEHERVLDIGCNSGYLPEFVPKNVECFGIDLSPALVEKARKRGYIEVKVAGAENLPFNDKFFTSVVMAGVIEYPFDVQKALQEAKRVARRCVLVEACHEKGVWGEHRISSHAHMVRSYNEETLVKEVSTIGKVTWINVIEGYGAPQHRIVEVTL